MLKLNHWLILTVLILGQLYRYGCETVYGGPDRLEHGSPVVQLSDAVRKEIEGCIFQYKRYEYKDIMKKCIEAYNGLRDPPDVFVKYAEANFGRHKPATGFRLRQEIRTLTDKQWARVVHVFQELYKRGTMRKFGMMHNHAEMRAHQGAAFPIWHRLFLLHLEEEMRKIDPGVSLPYWDYSLDADLDKPEDSIVWSDCFFGTPNGQVKTGPFGNELGRFGDPVVRHVGKEKIPLISSYAIDFILNGSCHYKDITTGKNATAAIRDLEAFHGYVHMFVGGDFDKAPESPFDLIYYFHHAFVDLIFQKFRNQQMNKTLCGDIDIENDYRPLDDVSGPHVHHEGPDDPVPGYSHLQYKHLLWKNWTTEFYNYAPQPSCPHNCGGKYLYCDMSFEDVPEGICMTRTKHDKVSCTPFKPVFGNAKVKDVKGTDHGKLKASVHHLLQSLYIKN